jgi:nitroimidazol reductase NimA-like FMN-containing flavoprotein (pyridoxamine 5'-phosphate oxidase superfamily)
MKEYCVVVASYAYELVNAESEEEACEIAMEIFEPTGEWAVAEVKEVPPYPQGEKA